LPGSRFTRPKRSAAAMKRPESLPLNGRQNTPRTGQRCGCDGVQVRRPASDIGYHALEIHPNRAHIWVMTTARKSSAPKLIRDSRTGEFREVRGFGALKGQLKITKGVDLTKPIYDQVAKKRTTAPTHKG
jgi:hypothetical protein